MVQRILARVIRCPYGSDFRTGLFPVDPFYIATTFLMGFARTQVACSSLLLLLLFSTSSKGVRVNIQLLDDLCSYIYEALAEKLFSILVYMLNRETIRFIKS